MGKWNLKKNWKWNLKKLENEMKIKFDRIEI